MNKLANLGKLIVLEEMKLAGYKDDYFKPSKKKKKADAKHEARMRQREYWAKERNKNPGVAKEISQRKDNAAKGVKETAKAKVKETAKAESKGKIIKFPRLRQIGGKIMSGAVSKPGLALLAAGASAGGVQYWNHKKDQRQERQARANLYKGYYAGLRARRSNG